MFNHAIGVLVKPSSQWRSVAQLPEASLNTLVLYPCIMAVLPAVAWFYGTTEVGWSVGDGDPIKLTADSARTIVILFYLAMITAVATIGYFIHWMAHTYGADSSTAKGIVIAGLSVTPMFLAGATGFYPLLWMDLLLGVIAVCWAVSQGYFQ